jgi:hypothetical protein
VFPKVFRRVQVDTAAMTYTAVYPTPRRRVSVLPAMTLVVVCLVGGLVVMNLALEGPSVSLAPSQRMPGIADQVRTSFGFVEVQRAVAQAPDASSAALEVRVGVLLHNEAELPLLFSSTEFELIDRKGRVVQPDVTPNSPSLLQPDGALDLSYRFVTTGAAEPFLVRFVDRTTRRSFDISLAGMQCVGTAPCPGGHV